jgi:phosphatidylinositol 4-kinase
MVKANDDCRQEVLAMQLITRVKQIWDGAKSNLWLRPYNIFITSSDSAIMEFIPDSVSIHGLKKQIANNQKMTGKLTGLK